MAGDEWELVHPRCAEQREEDMEEVRLMIEAGEPQVARDELIWLLSQCHDFIDAHRVLGELALQQRDLALARGHFGVAFRLGQKALEPAGREGKLPFRLPANRSFFEAGARLVHCLELLGKYPMALDVARQLLQLDPSDPMSLKNCLPRLEQNPLADGT